METTGAAYLESVKKRFRSLKELGDKTFIQLSDTEMHFEPCTGVNSIAVIIQHLVGNMHSRFTDFLTSDGEKPNRNRDEEFEEQLMPKEELESKWNSAWLILFSTLESLTASDLLKTVFVRSEEHTVLDAINRQLLHYSYHVGQIAYIGKIIKGNDWQTLSIPKGKSDEFNKKMMGR
ncbi:DUF1572 family protein [Solitalea koreensis]|uniref:DUF1572 domain-containing protein n=1 Tax=Solitalea koreensis TaxID=543615 RepID=A0A521CFC0_9SPHI|nr:DUF1572 family protein [Solitalea koreensis]SMO58126.1 Protein of unknown function [Solitalea koreensis]